MFLLISSVGAVAIKDRTGRMTNGTLEFRSNAQFYYSKDGAFLGSASYSKDKTKIVYTDAAGNMVGHAFVTSHKIDFYNVDRKKVGYGELLGPLVAYYDVKGKRTAITNTANGRTIVKTADGALVGMIDATGSLYRPLPLVEADRLWGLECIEMRRIGMVVESAVVAPPQKPETPTPAAQSASKMVMVISAISDGGAAQYAGVNVGDVWLQIGDWNMKTANMISKSTLRHEMSGVLKDLMDSEKTLYVYRLAAGGNGEVVKIVLPQGDIGAELAPMALTEEDFAKITQAYEELKK